MLRTRSPFYDMERTFDQMNRLFDFFDRPLSLRSVPRGTFPALNVYDEGEKFVVTAEIPGVKLKDIDLSVVENTLTLAGKREAETNGSEVRYYRRERPAGSFTRTLGLGEKVDPEKVKAEYKNGILTIEMPKLARTKAKSIQIKAN